jgi:hypothetical protein
VGHVRHQGGSTTGPVPEGKSPTDPGEVLQLARRKYLRGKWRGGARAAEQCGCGLRDTKEFYQPGGVFAGIVRLAIACGRERRSGNCTSAKLEEFWSGSCCPKREKKDGPGPRADGAAKAD